MFTRSRRFPSSSSSSSENRSSVSENSSKKVNAVKTHLKKKRPALTDVSNNRNASISRTSVGAPSKPTVPCMSKTASAKTKKDSIASTQKKVISGNTVSLKSSGLVLSKDACSTGTNQPKTGVETFLAPSTDSTVCPDSNSGVCAPRWMSTSLSKLFSSSVSLDESMSTSDSLMSPEFEYIDNDDAISIKSIENRTCSILNISDSLTIEGKIFGSDTIMKTEANEVVDIDYNIKNPQFCASIAHEIYEYLRVSEEIKRPSMDYMEKIQKDLNASMRATLIDWLVEGSLNLLGPFSHNEREHENYIKYEEICAPKVEEFCYVTDNTYSREQVLQMESAVLSFLKFEMTAPTTRCFLRRFIIVAQQTCEVPLMQLEYLADYLAELSLLEYGMLKYTPSIIAASATFLAIYILLPRKKPWNSMLRHYTGYQAFELRGCVKGLHWLYCFGCHNLPAIREKYSQHKFKFVAKKYCPPSIPEELREVILLTHLAMWNFAYANSVPIIRNSSYCAMSI
ncbi:Cyclin-like [Sesbania bispinosa]|nr:Cyclin-like [Sesbania bispinosa]